MSIELRVPLARPLVRDAVVASVRQVLQDWHVVGLPEPEVSDLDGSWPEPAAAGSIRTDIASVRAGSVEVELAGQAIGPELSCFVGTDVRDAPHFLFMVAVTVALARLGSGSIVDESERFRAGYEVPAIEFDARVRAAADRPQTLVELAAALGEWLARLGGASQ